MCWNGQEQSARVMIANRAVDDSTTVAIEES